MKTDDPQPLPFSNVADLALLLGALQKGSRVDDTPYLVIPENFHVESLEHLKNSPARRRGLFTTDNVGSWTEYVKKYGLGNRSAIFLRENDTLCILDFHEGHTPEGGKAGWCEHQAILVGKRNFNETLNINNIPVYWGDYQVL